MRKDVLINFTSMLKNSGIYGCINKVSISQHEFLPIKYQDTVYFVNLNAKKLTDRSYHDLMVWLKDNTFTFVTSEGVTFATYEIDKVSIYITIK